MTRFIAGIAVACLAHLLGWPRIESAIRAANGHVQTAYHAAETQLRNAEAGK